MQDQAESSAVHNQDVLGEVWNYVRRNILLIQWEHHIETANEIKERYVRKQKPFNSFPTLTINPVTRKI